MRVDTEPFDRAVAGIMKYWKPPPDIKKVVISELGAILALASGDTLTAGPKGKKNKTVKQAQSYLKRRYTWKAQSGKGRRSKQGVDSIRAVTLGGRVYFRGNRYPSYLWESIMWELEKRKKKAMKRAGSSKAAWMYMFMQAQKATRTRVATPKSWKDAGIIREVMDEMKESKSWVKATRATKKKSRTGDFFLKVFSEAHNTLNPGVKGAAVFQARLNGRQAYMEKVFGKTCKATLKKLLKKYPGLSVGDHA